MPKTQSAKSKKTTKPSFWRRHRWFGYSLLLLAIIITGVVIWQATDREKADSFQKKLAPFYDTAGLPAQGKMGEVVRQEPLGVDVPNGKGLRVLYRTQKPDGTPTFSSGMVFIPNAPSAGGRPVVAWAHGTLGMGTECAPSRLQAPLDNLAWLAGMLQKGWVVTATDYAGFGTPGIQGYLVGQAEANDVLNSVRAARNIPATQATDRFAIFGHSQGGHSALFSANQAASYAPELTLMGTVAAAPAAEIVPILDQSEGTPMDWVIGPDIMVSWPAFNNQLNPDDVLTKIGRDNYETIANTCIGKAVLGGLLRTELKEKFFATNPIDNTEWRAEADAQTAPVLTPSQPLLVVESLTDTVIPPNTTEDYIQKSCAAGLPLNTIWIDKVGHPEIAEVAGPQITSWLYDQFAGKRWTSNCGPSQPEF